MGVLAPVVFIHAPPGFLARGPEVPRDSVPHSDLRHQVASHTMSTVTVRAFVPSDTTAVTDMYIRYHLFFRVGDTSGEARGVIDQAIASGDSLIVVAEVGAATVGFARVTPVPAVGEHWYIQDLWVEPAYRRHGVATVLMREIEVQARRAAAPFLAAEVWVENPQARALMRRLGFQHADTEGIMTRWEKRE